MSHGAEKCKKGNPLLHLLTYILLQNIKKLKGGSFWRQQKIFEKKSHSAEKIQRGDHLGTSCFVGYVEKVKKLKGDSFETKKYIARDELCGRYEREEK